MFVWELGIPGKPEVSPSRLGEQQRLLLTGWNLVSLADFPDGLEGRNLQSGGYVSRRSAVLMERARIRADTVDYPTKPPKC